MTRPRAEVWQLDASMDFSRPCLLSMTSGTVLKAGVKSTLLGEDAWLSEDLFEELKQQTDRL